MKERPILFSAPMVRAILAGTKTQTRRAAKPQLSEVQWIEERESGFFLCADGQPTCCTGVWETHEYALQAPIHCPYGQSGDRLWVRETWAGQKHRPLSQGALFYRATDGEHCCGKQLPLSWVEREPRWRPSIHMPRWASRITLEVTGVRVERLQDISEADCIAEGAPGGHGAIPGYGYAATPSEHYRDIWTSINGAESWDANPWVWVIEFQRIAGAQEVDRG